MHQIGIWLGNGWNVVLVVVGLGMVIFLHELGHFLMAKKNGVRVEIFSLGFGQAIFKFRRGETEYRIAWLPLGGYVKMAGETLMDDRKGEPFELTSKTPWQRFQIFVAGAVMNLLIAFPIAVLSYVVGKCEAPNVIGTPSIADAQAEKPLKAGDVIVEVDGRKIDSLDKYRIEMIRHSTGTMVPVKFIREGKPEETRVQAMRSSFHQSIPPSTALVDPPADKPLYAQGVREKDEIAKVNDVEVFTQEKAFEELRYLQGKDVTIDFRRRDPKFQDDDKTFKVHLTLAPKKWYEIPIDENLLESRVGLVLNNRPAADNLEPEDLILKIGARPIRSWAEMKEVVEASPGKTLEFQIQRGSESLTKSITPMKNEKGKGAIGIGQKFTPVFADVKEGSYFYRMGVRSLDRLVSVDGHKLEGVKDASLRGAEGGRIPPVIGIREEQPKTLHLEVQRGSDVKMIDLVAEEKVEADLAAAGFKTDHGFLATGESFPFRQRDFGPAVRIGLQEPVDITVMTVDILRKLITLQESAKGLSGPLGIIRASYSFAQRNFGNFVWLLCLITVNLGIFNLLPIPVLDGGHNVLLLIEVVRKWFGKPPPSEKFIAGFQYVGLAFILTLFVFVTYNDISNLFSRG
ncbi:MAG TPA: site-2 protease family protein [Planctomycetota bacterium]|nr:site-2 protease family protein [Planctomycetota bacterium]